MSKPNKWRPKMSKEEVQWRTELRSTGRVHRDRSKFDRASSRRKNKVRKWDY